MTPSTGCPVLQIRVTMYVSSNEVDVGERDPLLERTHTTQVYPLVTTVQVYGVDKGCIRRDPAWTRLLWSVLHEEAVMSARTDSDESNTPKDRPRMRTRLTRLTTEQVLATALEIVDRESVDALSMRRLAQALDRDAMSVYRYAENKAALLDGVVELVLRELVIDPDAQDWTQELRLLAHRYRDLALAHPNVVPLLVTRPLATPLGLRPLGTLRPLEDFLELLIRAGFSPPIALRSYRLFFGFLQGHILDELQELIEDPEESEDVLRLGLHRLPRSKFPRLRSLASELADYDGAQLLDEGLDVTIGGLETLFQTTTSATGT